MIPPPITSGAKHPLNKIKICRISTVPFFMVTQLKGQVEYLRDIGMDVALVSSDGPEWSIIDAGKGISVKVVNIPRTLKPWQDLIALIRLTHFFSNQRFEIVHSTTPKAGLLTAIAAFIAGVPIRLHTFTGQPWVTLKGFIRFGSRLADKVISVMNTKCYADSDSQARFMVEEGILSSRKIAVIGQGSLAGVDMDRFSPDKWTFSAKQEIRQSLSIPPFSKVIIFIGRISPDKGLVELISAFKNLLNFNYDVDLLLVGPRDEDCGGASSSKLSGTGEESRIHFTGYTECPEKYLAIADIFCLPSYREGFGTVAIEAAAMGLPTVGTMIYGLTDAVADGKTGILVPPRDALALHDALRRLLERPEEMKRMGEAARRRCSVYFDAKWVNQKLAEEYVNMLTMKKRSIGA